MSFILLRFFLTIIGLLLLQSGFSGGCTDGDVRLEDGDRQYEGRVELCYKGEWGTLCDKGSTNHAAKVVCRQLGLPLNDPKVVWQYPGGNGPIHLYGIACRGTEQNLLDCAHIKLEERYDHCIHPYDFGVICAPPCSEGEVRLLLDRVQTCHNEVWGYVCTEHGWSRNEAAVVCRELGLSSEDALSDHAYIHFNHSFPYFLNATNCNGSEMHLINCSLGSDKALCNDYNNVAVAYCSGNSQCNETGVLRITHLGTKTDILGRLEMCYNGYWGTVCIHYTNDLTAAVACRKLGYYNVVKG
jgi:hypothetical protein